MNFLSYLFEMGFIYVLLYFSSFDLIVPEIPSIFYKFRRIHFLLHVTNLLFRNGR